MNPLSEMTLEELWALFPIDLRPHDTAWSGWYEEEKEFLDKVQVIEEYLRKNKIGRTQIKLNKKYLKEVVIKLKEECNLTHQEIADEVGINRVKVTRIINGR